MVCLQLDEEEEEEDGLFNNALNIFYLQLYGTGHTLRDKSF